MSDLYLASGVVGILKSPPLSTDVSFNEAHNTSGGIKNKFFAQSHAGLQILPCIPDKSAMSQSRPIMKSLSVWGLSGGLLKPLVHTFSKSAVMQTFLSNPQFIAVLQH